MNIDGLTPDQLDQLALECEARAAKLRGGHQLLLTEPELNALGNIVSNTHSQHAAERSGHKPEVVASLHRKVSDAQGHKQLLYWG